MDNCIFNSVYQLAKYGYKYPNVDEAKRVIMQTKLCWDDLELFLAVAENGSLSAAARHLKLGQPTLSRRMQALEVQVGEPLFNRLSKGSVLTLAGQHLLPAAQRMAEWAVEAQSILNRKQNLQAQGKVRIAAPPGIATELLLPLVASLRKSHPAIHVQILAGVETLNLSRGEADLSLRTSRPNDADLDVLDSLTSKVGIFASAQYASRLNAKTRIDQLDWIAWAPPYEHLALNSLLNSHIPDFQPVFTSDDFLVLLAACRAGVGVLPLANAISHSKNTASLVPISLAGFPQVVSELFLVGHKRHRHLTKLQPVINLIQAQFKLLRS
jgi:DNA-binding transcriptional LysR family regulator